MKLYFLRHGKLDVPYKDHSEMPFELVADLASLKLNPPIDEAYSTELLQDVLPKIGEVDKIFMSPSKRCQDTAQLISKSLGKDIEPQIFEGLLEVRFDLRELFDLSERDNMDISILNDKVFNGILSGMCEPLDSVMHRVEAIFKFLEDRDGNILCVTHDFLMRFIEIYIRSAGVPEKIDLDLLHKTQRNLYLRGFSVEKDLSHFEPL
jgi:broad specificity phosphatase PhoE